MLHTFIILFLNTPGPHVPHKVDHKADMRVSEHIIDSSKNGENSRKRQLHSMWRDEYKLARK